ncbi:MAG: leucine-rich repeat protein [Clostridiales bacterium]|nr:leucine-rich repeat protein [Clostridiales bacterium]
MTKRIIAVLLTASLMLISGLPTLTLSAADVPGANEPAALNRPTGGYQPVYGIPVDESAAPSKAPSMRKSGGTGLTPPPSREGRLIFDSLTEGQRQLYMFILTLAENLILEEKDFEDAAMSAVAPVTESISEADALTAYWYFKDNEPQFFWIHNAYSYSLEGGKLSSFQIFSWYTTDEIASMQAEIDAAAAEPLAAAVNMPSDAQKARYFYDWIIKRGTYCNAAVSNPELHRYAFSIYGIAVMGTGVCESYSELFVYLLGKCGIEAYSINGGKHAWSIAYIDGAWYEFDATWDDAGEVSPYAYFAITTAVMLKNHTRAENNYVILAPVADTIAIANDFIIDGDIVISVDVLTKYKGPGGVLYLPGGIASVGFAALSPDYIPARPLYACVIPEGVTAIDTYAFYYCDSLTSLALPASLVSVGANVFNNTPVLNKVYYSGSAEDYALITIDPAGNDSFAAAEKLCDFTPLAYQRADYGDADLGGGAAFADIAAMRAAIAAGGSSAHDLNRDLVVNLRDLLILRRLIAGVR